MSHPKIIKCEETKLSPWFTVVSRLVQFNDGGELQEYHSLRQADYVCVLAETTDGRVPLVRQFRPAMETFTLELPAGLRDANEVPEQTALRELTEETGCKVQGEMEFIGSYIPDTGRLENRLWGYHAVIADETVEGWSPEAGVERLFVTKEEFKNLILNGGFSHALHLALISAAMLQGKWQW